MTKKMMKRIVSKFSYEKAVDGYNILFFDNMCARVKSKKQINEFIATRIAEAAGYKGAEKIRTLEIAEDKEAENVLDAIMAAKGYERA